MMKYKLRDTVTRERFNQVTFGHQQIKEGFYEKCRDEELTGFKGKHFVITNGHFVFGYFEGEFNELFEEVEE